jgi:hypothetical protein
VPQAAAEKKADEKKAKKSAKGHGEAAKKALKDTGEAVEEESKGLFHYIKSKFQRKKEADTKATQAAKEV